MQIFRWSARGGCYCWSPDVVAGRLTSNIQFIAYFFAVGQATDSNLTKTATKTRPTK